jgi:hypothetical protein
VPTVVRGGTAPTATLVLTRPAQPDELERTAVPVEKLATQLVRLADDADGRLLRAEVELPRQWLSGGLEVVDTPGVGGVRMAATLGTVDLLPTAAAVLVVTDASQEFTAPELAFVRQAVALCEHVVVVEAKTDLYPSWRQIADLDRGHLARAGLDVPVFCVSTVLEVAALAARDAELHAESGIGPLRDHLREEVVERAAERRERALAHDVASVTEQLKLAVKAELAVMEDPASVAGIAAQAEAARVRVEELGRNNARWQQLLNDGVTDLMGDIDYDLRDRTRVIAREAEVTIDANDPGQIWDEIADWLEERIAGAMGDSFVWAAQRSQWLAAQVVEQFAAERAAVVPHLQIGPPD